MNNPCGVVLATAMCCFLLVASQGGACASAQPPPYWPTQGWRASTPEEQGMDSELLAKGVEFLLKEHPWAHSLLVIRNGYVVADAYFYPFSPNQKHDLASATKAFTATVVGIAIQEGIVRSVDQPALELFPNRTVAKLDANKTALTVEHLLAMAVQWGPGPEQRPLELSPDWTQSVLDAPVDGLPGTSFRYAGESVVLLSGIISETTGSNAFAFAREHLFGPLGISDAVWYANKHGLTIGWGDLALTPHDTAKLGYLYLHDGIWEEKRLLPPGWVEQATRKRISTLGEGEPHPFVKLHDGFGYMWWVRSDGKGYVAVGSHGQRLVVFPTEGMVVVITGGGDPPDTGMKRQEFISSFLLPAVTSDQPLAPNPSGMAALQEAVSRAAIAPEVSRQAVPPLPPIASDIGGRTYVFHPNPYIENFALSFVEGSAEAKAALGFAVYNNERFLLDFPVGLDGSYRDGIGRAGLPARARGRWENGNVFVLELDEIGNRFKWEFRITFEDGQAKVHLRDLAGEFAELDFVATAVQ